MECAAVAAHRVPLIYVEDTLIAMPGYFVAEGFVAKEGQEGYIFNVQPE